MRVTTIAHAGRRTVTLTSPLIGLVASTSIAYASACSFEPQGIGRIADVIDIRTLRMSDGAEIRLAGIEPAMTGQSTAALSALIPADDVAIHSDSDTPDRYGRQPAFIFTEIDGPPLQARLLNAGAAFASGSIPDRACAAELAAAEAAARRAKTGIWSRDDVIKNAAIPGDILAQLGRFVVVEGRVLSVREAGTMTYLNFGRRWTRDFAVSISRRMMTAFARAGVTLKSLERRRIRVRGWVESRGGPRIEARHVGQIEVVGDQ
jgi:endonuclease YncB( thermonuclease family)